MNHAARIAFGLALAVTFATAVVAEELRPDRAIRYRQGIMYAINLHFGVLNRMVKGETPYNKDAALRSATYMSELSRMPWDGFVPVSHEGRTHAKPEIWNDKAEFDRLAEAMQAEMPKLVAAARTGDPAQLKAALAPTAQACDNCHDKFRKE